MTPAERQQLKRDRRKAGLVLVQEWVPAQAVEAVRAAMAAAVNSEARRAAVAPGKAKIGVDSPVTRDYGWDIEQPNRIDLHENQPSLLHQL